jgi:hypothetical protein
LVGESTFRKKVSSAIAPLTGDRFSRSIAITLQRGR